MPSKARQLADDIRAGVTALPQGLITLCQSITAKGGPKPPLGTLTNCSHKCLAVDLGILCLHVGAWTLFWA